MSEIAGTVLAVAVCLLLVVLLGVIVRFSIIGPARTKGWQYRLRHPEIPEVEAKWGVKLPQAMDEFFRSEIVESSDFTSRPRTRNNRIGGIWRDSCRRLDATSLNG